MYTQSEVVWLSSKIFDALYSVYRHNGGGISSIDQGAGVAPVFDICRQTFAITHRNFTAKLHLLYVSIIYAHVYVFLDKCIICIYRLQFNIYTLCVCIRPFLVDVYIIDVRK